MASRIADPQKQKPGDEPGLHTEGTSHRGYYSVIYLTCLTAIADLRRSTMPLTSTREPGYLDPRTDNVIFWMLDGQRRVHCAVSRQALEAFDPTLNFAASLLRCFRANRAAIERAAAAKYDRWDIRGMTVMVLEVDIEPV